MSIQVVHPYNSIDTATALKKSHFILSEIRFFHMMDNLSIAVHAFTVHMLTSFTVDEILLPKQLNWSTNFRGLPLKLVMVPSCLNHMNSVLFV